MADGAIYDSRPLYSEWEAAGRDRRTLKQAMRRMSLKGELTYERHFGPKQMRGLISWLNKRAGLINIGSRSAWMLTDRGRAAAKELFAVYGYGGGGPPKGGREAQQCSVTGTRTSGGRSPELPFRPRYPGELSPQERQWRLEALSYMCRDYSGNWFS